MKSIAEIIHKQSFPIIILDSKGNEIYYENLYGAWWIYGYNDQGNAIYYENSCGLIVDKRQ